MSYRPSFAGPGEHFTAPTSMDLQHHSTQPYAPQYAGSLEGSPDMSDTSQNSLPRVYSDNGYPYTTQPLPVSMSPLPMGAYAPVTHQMDSPVGNPQPSWPQGVSPSSFNEQWNLNLLAYMQNAGYDVYARRTPHYGVATANPNLAPFLQGQQTPYDEPALRGNNDTVPDYDFETDLGLDAEMEAPLIPQVGTDAHVSTGIGSDPNLQVGVNQNEIKRNAATTYHSPIASHQSPLDASTSPQPVEMETSQTEDANGEQNNSNLRRIDSHLQLKFLPPTTSGVGSRGGKESLTCTYPECKHRPFTRQDQARDHVAGHLGLKTVLCQHCQKGFVRPYDCNRHMERSCRSARSSTTTGLRPLAPAPGDSPGAISPISAGSPSQLFGIPSEGRANQEDARNLQMIGPHRNFMRTRAPSKSSPRSQVRPPGSKRGQRRSKSPSSAGGSPHPYGM